MEQSSETTRQVIDFLADRIFKDIIEAYLAKHESQSDMMFDFLNRTIETIKKLREDFPHDA
jgi:hypothetical protein